MHIRVKCTNLNKQERSETQYYYSIGINFRCLICTLDQLISDFLNIIDLYVFNFQPINIYTM